MIYQPDKICPASQSFWPHLLLLTSFQPYSCLLYLRYTRKNPTLRTLQLFFLHMEYYSSEHEDDHIICIDWLSYLFQVFAQKSPFNLGEAFPNNLI